MLRTRRVSSKGLLSPTVHIAAVWNYSKTYSGKLLLGRAGAVLYGYGATCPRIGIGGALRQTVPARRVGEVRVQTMGCFGDSAPKIISGGPSYASASKRTPAHCGTPSRDACLSGCNPGERRHIRERGLIGSS